MKRHPILAVLVIFLVIALVLGTTLVVALRILAPSKSMFFSEKIGVITINGIISSSQTITSELVKFKNDESISAIVLRINSPGGGIGPTQEIHREIQKTVLAKKVIVSMGAVAASGGYYVAAAADRIVANPGTITGSIGVLMEFVRMEDLLNKIGLDLEILKSGEFKDIGSPDRKLTARDREILNTLIMELQKQFVNAIARGRNLSVGTVEKIADGRIFSGARAKELGLVDSLGNFQDAVELAKEMAGIKGDVTLVHSKKGRSRLLDLLIETGVRSAADLLRNLECRIEYRWIGFLGQNIRESY